MTAKLSNLSDYSIDNVIELYELDRRLSLGMFELTSKIEIKLKAYLIDVVYHLKDINDSDDLEYRFISNYLQNRDKKIKDFVMDCIRKR